MTLGLHNTKALIVDDEPYIRELLARYLKPEGFDCLIAGSGEEALELLARDDFDLLISDVMMPGMSGVDLLNVVKKYHPGTAVILVTAVDDAETGVMALEMGAYGYIIKPFTKNQILIDVAAALKRKEASQYEYEEAEIRDESSDNVDTPYMNPGEVKEDIAGLILAGAQDCQLMEQFGLSAKKLRELLKQLVDDGLLTRSDIESRYNLSAQTVAISPEIHQNNHQIKPKLQISAKDAIQCIRSGMDDLSLMKRYDISAKGLASLFRKLIEENYLQPEHFYGASPSCHDIALEQDIPPRFLALSARVYDARNPRSKGFLTQIDEKGLNVVGIESKKGDKKTLKIHPGGVIQSDDIWMDALCVDSEINAVEDRPSASFQIRNISTESLEKFRELIQALSFNF